MRDVVEAEPVEEVSGNVALEETEPAESEASEPSQAEMIGSDDARHAPAKAPQGAESADGRQTAGAKINRCAHVARRARRPAA